MTEWEPIHGTDDAFQRFACDPPPEGSTFQVLREEWDEDSTHRTIFEVRLIDGEADAD
jgi:hypothetical protein